MIYFTKNISDNYYYYIIIIAILFYILTKLQASILISIMIVIVIAYYIDYNIRDELTNNKNKAITVKEKLRQEVKDVKELNVQSAYVNENNKNLKFLVKNREFLDILHNIRFIKKFDRSRYTNLIVYMDNLMKVYIYILADRYDINTYLPLFNDLKSEVLEIMYSLIFVIPDKFKHIYGFDPHQEIQKSLEDFYKKTNNMITVIRNYSKIGKNEYYINLEKYRPYEVDKELYLP